MKENTPVTKKVDYKETLHGQELSDSYRWLEQDSSERTEWIEKQNAVTKEYFNSMPLRSEFKERLEELLKVDNIYSPFVKEDRIFYYKKKHDEQNHVLHYRDWPNGEEKVLINPNKLAEDGSIALLGSFASKDGSLLAYALTKNGSDWFKIKVMDVDSGKELDEIPRLAYSNFSWVPDKSGFYYSRSEHTNPDELTKINHRLYFHKLGTDWKTDKLIFGDNNLGESDRPNMDEVSKDGKHGIISVQKSPGDEEIYYMNLETKQINSITNGIEGLFNTEIKDNQLYILTNYDASNFKLCKASLDTVPTIDKWEVVIPEEKDAVLSEFSVFENKIFVDKFKNVSSQIEEYDSEGKLQKRLQLPGIGSASVPYGREENGAVFMHFESFFYPFTTFKYDLDTGDMAEFSKNNYPFNPNDYTAEQLWFKSKDGVEVPMFITRKKDTKIDGTNPTILYGYGGFNVGLYPDFTATYISWLDNGGVFAVANLRGGSELGEDWHKAGMKDKKQNVFDDFISAGEALIGKNPSKFTDEKEYVLRAYTNSNQLGINGGSNGGLLVGAALVQRPDLWKTAYSVVPLLDMLRFQLTEGGKYWTAEYGNPDVKEDFEFLLAYSPYHNVKDGEKYPLTVFETSLGDDRGVDPMHAMKMAARVQEANASDNPILLNVKSGTGHGHSKPISMIVDEYTDYFSLMAGNLGMTKK